MTIMYALDGAARSLCDAARKLASEVALPAAAEVDRDARFPIEALAALAEQGFFGLCVPAEFGGKGQPPRVFAAVTEQLAAACPSTAMIYVMHVVAAQAIAASPRLANRRQVLRDIAAGKHLTTLAFSERGSRSQFWAPLSTLEPSPDGHGYRVTADKSWVTSAHHADSYVSSAQMPGAAAPLESTLYLLDRQADGVRIAGTFDGLGLRGNDSAPVEIRDAAIAEEQLLCDHGAAATMILEVVLPWFSVGTAAMSNGLCLAAVAATRDHLSSAGFQHDGTRLRDLANLRTRLADMSLRTEQSRALLAHTVASMERPSDDTPLYVLLSRLSALTAALDVTDGAMKACGGTAFSKHLGIERLFRDARAGWVMAPTVDHLQEFVGRALTGLPLM